MNYDHSVVDALARSEVYREYQTAFTEATGLPLSLRPAESGQFLQDGTVNEKGLCALLAQQNGSCANCLSVRQKLHESAAHGPYTVVCGAGISETAVPVRLGEKLIGFLCTGQAFRSRPTAARFDRVAKMVRDWGVEVDLNELKGLYFGTPVVSSRQYASTVRLLAVFAEHLALLGNQMLVQEQTAESPAIVRAKKFIIDHHGEDLSLRQAANAAHMSPFYFCKVFKRMTGVHFTDYLSGVRIEAAKTLLLNRNLRVSEIAYKVGFQSLTHFNRVFKAMAGQNPSKFRDLLPAIATQGVAAWIRHRQRLPGCGTSKQVGGPI